MAKVKLSFFRMIRSEWIKIFSVRSTWWVMLVCILINIALSCAFAASIQYTEFTIKQHPELNIDPGDTFVSLSATVVMACGLLGQLVFMILSVLIITNEYSTGMARSTFTVAPRRIRVLISKMFVLVILCTIVFAISVAASWGLGYLILQQSTLVDLTLVSDTSLRILSGFLVKMILVALFCFGLGAMIRSSAGSIGTAVAIILVLPVIASLSASMISGGGEPTGWREWIVNIGEFLPTNAGDLVTQDSPSSKFFGPWEGIGVLGVWAFLSLFISFIATARRDL